VQCSVKNITIESAGIQRFFWGFVDFFDSVKLSQQDIQEHFKKLSEEFARSGLPDYHLRILLSLYILIILQCLLFAKYFCAKTGVDPVQ
jgi:hypothetical protein